MVFGAGATIGGQDWMQTALIARAAGVDPQKLRCRLRGRRRDAHRHARRPCAGHLSGLGEVTPQLDAGKIRILAVLSTSACRASWPTSPPPRAGLRHQLAGDPRFYMGPEVSDEDFNWWKSQFDSLLADEEDFAKLREQRDLFRCR